MKSKGRFLFGRINVVSDFSCVSYRKMEIDDEGGDPEK